VLIVALGALGAHVLIKLKKPPARKDPNELAPLVETVELSRADIQMVVRGHGTVSPEIKVDLVPEVAGKVVHVHPHLKVGGFIEAGQKMLQIDPRDYELAVQQAEAAVAEAQVRLDTEKAEALVARKEWQELHPGTEPNSPLVLRIPQIRRAEAALASAKAQLAMAELKLERTALSLPFDALIAEERVDLGQFVVAGQPVGLAYGIDSVEIELPLEDKELAWFDVFEKGGSSDGMDGSAGHTKALVKAEFAGAEHTWDGRVVRTTGQVDRLSRMVSVVIEVSNPFETTSGRPPLLPGAFVEVLIRGKTIRGAFAVPRDAIRQGNKVWLFDNGRLRIRDLHIVRADEDYAYVTSGLEDGARVITSSLDTVLDDMTVRVQGDGAPTGEGAAAEPNSVVKPEGN